MMTFRAFSWGAALRLCATLAALGLAEPTSAPAQQRLSPFTTTTFVPDGQISEFISIAGNSQEYFVVDPGMGEDYGAIKVGALLTRGVLVLRDNDPLPAKSFPAGPTGFADAPFLGPSSLVPTGFNMGRVFVSYNANAYDGEGAYFVAMDISAPAPLDPVAGTVPIAFDVDGNGSRTTQTEVVTPGTISEAPTVEDVYLLGLDVDSDTFFDVEFVIAERRVSVPFGDVPIDPNGVPQTIGGVTVRRYVRFSDASGMFKGNPAVHARFFLDANDDGVLDFRDFGIGTDVEFVIRNVRHLHNVLGSTAACVRFQAFADSSDDSTAEDRIATDAAFPVADLEVTKEVRCTSTDSPFGDRVQVTPGSEVEFRITIENQGNRNLNVTIDDTLSCMSPASVLLSPKSCQIVGPRPPGVPVTFCGEFEDAVSSFGFPISVGTLAASGGCAADPGGRLVFTYRVLVGESDAPGGEDCTNLVSVTGQAAIFDPILAGFPPGTGAPDDGEEEHCETPGCCTGILGCTPGDAVGDVADEFAPMAADSAGAIDTLRELAAGADDNIVIVGVDKQVTMCACGSCQLYGDITPPSGNCLVDLDDLFCVLDGFADSDVCPQSDIAPCDGGNNLIDLDDIFAVLDAFAAAYACTHPCPP